ncbi:mRNA splicing protein prp28 [Actinomortierella wolfii]|nr:mRNA splicing protein prp28 [Actinomortierella wolfii]
MSSYSTSRSRQDRSHRDRSRSRERDSYRNRDYRDRDYDRSDRHRDRSRDRSDASRNAGGSDYRSNRDGYDSYRGSRSTREESSRDSRRQSASPPPASRSKVTDSVSTPKEDVEMTDASTPSSSRKVPISIEELVKAKQQEKLEESKPKFLTKEERAQLALERRAKEVEEKRRQQEEERRQRAEFNTKARQDLDLNRFGYDSRSSPRPDRSGSGKHDRSSTDNESSADKEIEMIKRRYMGIDDKVKKVKRRNDKKFVFDWNNDDDTSRDLNPIYNHRHSAQLFGRGHFAGMDVKSSKNRSDFYDKLLASRRSTLEQARVDELEDKAQQKERRINYADRHWSEKPLDQMRERDWRIFKEDFNISCKGGSIPNPIRRWEESTINANILRVIKEVGYTEPTPIQRQAIPIGLQNRDLIGIAETGSGKTASFLIPLLQYISDLPKLDESNQANGPYSLILAPTRELAQQIEKESLKFAIPLGFNCVSIVGGHSLEEQAFALRNGAEIIIATPGRLKDCLDRRILVLSQCTYVVMDEADRMINMGFEADVNFILDALPASNVKPDTEDAEDATKMTQSIDGKNNLKYRQTTMFSATMPPAVERLAKAYLRRPAVVTIGQAGQAVETVEQRVEMISDENKKKNRLLELLQSKQFAPPMIVFVNQRRSCDTVARAINSVGIKAVTLHGGKQQEQREAALEQLRNGRMEVLVATEVAGRGIDIPNVSLVVNFDMAKNIEEYTHRIGRTGRAGKSGVAVTFLSSSDTDVYYDLKQMLQKSSISSIPAELRNHEAAQVKGGMRRLRD